MSLVILTNDASEAEVAGRENSINKPFSFRNALTSTIEIPVQAQIALQSTKLVMDGSLQVGDTNGVFYLYLGRYILPDGNPATDPITIGETGYAPIRFQLFPDNTQTKSVTPEELGDELQRVLNLTSAGGLFHPNYIGGESVVSLKVSATGAFEGYNIDFKYIADTLQSLNTSAATAIVFRDAALDATSFGRRPPTLDPLTGNPIPNGGMGPRRALSVSLAQANANKPYTMSSAGVGVGTHQVIMTPRAPFVPSTFGTTFNVAPISTFRGTCEFDITDAVMDTSRGTGAAARDRTCRFLVGLSRVSVTSTRAALKPAPPNFKPRAGEQVGVNYPAPATGPYLSWIDNYFDYGVCVDGLGFLRVVQCVQDQNVPPGAANNGGTRQNNSARTLNVDYTQHHAGGPFNTQYVMSNVAARIAGAAADGNASNFRSVQFKVEGEIVTISMRNDAGALTELITFDAAINPNNLKPAQQTCWSMQPIMLMNLAFQAPGAQQASGLAITDYNLKCIDYTIVPDSAGGFNNINSTPQNCPSYYMSLLEDKRGISGLYHRIENAMGTNYPYAQTGINVGAGTYVGNRPVLIVAEDGVYSPSQGANSQLLLGFRGFPSAVLNIPPWVADAFDGGRITTQRVGSGVVPTNASTKSLFIRIDNLTQETINAGNGNMSRIIAHIPISDNVEDAGKNFYEPNSLSYLDLKNAEPMKLNFLDASVVYADESVCRSLVGSSVIVLHIREKPKKDE